MNSNVGTTPTASILQLFIYVGKLYESVGLLCMLYIRICIDDVKTNRTKLCKWSMKDNLLLYSQLFFSNSSYFYIIINIIIIVSKKGRQRNAWTERFTPSQCKDPSPTIPTYRKKDEKVKTVEDKKRARRLTQ